MARILGSKITPPNQDGNEEGCFCNIKAKKIYAGVTRCGFADYGDPPNYSKPPVIYLKYIVEQSGEDSASGLTGCCAGGSDVNWSASTQYRIVYERNPRTCEEKLKECSGTTQKNGSLTGGHSGSDPCCICYGRGSYSGNWNGQATLSLQVTPQGKKECQWKGSYTFDSQCSGGPQTGDVTGPLCHLTEEKHSYESEFDQAMFERLIQELFDNCRFEKLEWNQQMEAKFEETEDGSDTKVTCGEPEALFKSVWDRDEEEYRCAPCAGLYGQRMLMLTVEFYTDKRKKEERTLIQQAKAQFIPKTDHYWKIFIPQLFSDYETGETEKRDDFPIVCELVKTEAGKKIDIDPPEDPGHYVIMNCADAINDLSRLEWDSDKGKYVGCMKKKNFPKILEDI